MSDRHARQGRDKDRLYEVRMDEPVKHGYKSQGQAGRGEDGWASEGHAGRDKDTLNKIRWNTDSRRGWTSQEQTGQDMTGTPRINALKIG